MGSPNPRLGHVRIKNDPLMALQLIRLISARPATTETYNVYVCLICGRLYWGHDAERRIIKHLHRRHGVTMNHNRHYATLKLGYADYMLLRSIVKNPYNKNLLLSALKSSIQK